MANSLMDDAAYDMLAGDIVELLLEDAGVVRREHRVAAAAQRLDAVFTPTRQGRNLLRARGLLGRMAARVCAFEFFHNAPSVDELREVVRKHLTWHHRRTARRSCPIAALWVVCASRPDAALRALGARSCMRWPRGVYEVSTAMTAMRIVVLGELGPHRDTLTLRLMGRGAVLDQAMREFESLPPGSRERAVAGAVVDFMERRRTEHAMSPRTDYLRKKVQDLLDEGRVKGRVEGRDEGRVEGLAPLTHVFERRLQRALTDAEHATIRARLDQVGPTRLGDVVLDLDAESLARWIRDPDAR